MSSPPRLCPPFVQVLVGLLLPALCACTEAPDRTTLPARTPVILIVIDTLRADHLSCYGYELETSPVLDAFAAKATRFSANSTQCNSTFPSITSIMTGLYTRTHRNYLAVPVDGLVQTNREHSSLAEHLDGAGYRALAVLSHPGWTRDDRSSTWFGNNREAAMMRGWDRLSMISGDIPVSQRPRAGNARYTNERAFELLDEYEEGGLEDPLFLWVHYFDPHTDLYPWVYYPPPEYWNRYLRHHLELVGEEGIHGELAKVDPAERASFITAQAAGDKSRRHRLRLANGRSLYDAEISYCDWEIGRLFERLRRMGLYDDALIIVMSDHGENMEGDGPRGGVLFSHEKLYESVVNTPLILKLPGQREPLEVDALTQNIDVMPTVLELLGLTHLSPVEGASLVSLLRDEEPQVHDEVYAESSNEPQWAVKTDALKLIDTSGETARTELYRWRKDPGETDDLAGTVEPRVLERMREFIEAFKPQNALRIRLVPDSEPYEVSLRLQLGNGAIERVVGADPSCLSEDGDELRLEVRVEDRAEDLVLILERRNVRQLWTIERSGSGSTREHVFLGRLPVASTAAIPILVPGDEPAPAEPVLHWTHRPRESTLEIDVDARGATRVEADLTFFEADYGKSVEVLEAEGFDRTLRRRPSGWQLAAEGGGRVRALLRVNGPDPLAVVRLDGRWPAEGTVSVGNRAQRPEPLRFVVPWPLDGRVTAAMTVVPGSDETPPGGIAIWYESAGGGAEIDTSAMDPELIEQLSTLGYVDTGPGR